MTQPYVKRSVISDLDNLGISRVAANRIDSVQSGRFCNVALTGCDHLTVAGLEAKTIGTGSVSVELKLTCHEVSPS